MHDRARHSVAPNRPPVVSDWSFSVRSVNLASLWHASMLFVQVNLEQFNPIQTLFSPVGHHVKSNNCVGECCTALAKPRRYFHCFSPRCQGQSNYRCNAVLIALLSSGSGTAFNLTNNFITIYRFQCFCLERASWNLAIDSAGMPSPSPCLVTIEWNVSKASCEQMAQINCSKATMWWADAQLCRRKRQIA